MLRCRICNVPLSGFLSNIGRLLFKVKPSSKDSQICNKCAGKQAVKHAPRGCERPSVKKEGPTYQCQICTRMILTERALEHIKAEEYIINLIKKDHPQWQDKEPTCPECIEYYRQLIDEAEI